MSRLDDRTPEASIKIRRALAGLAEDLAEELLRAANETIPFDTGTLAQSGQVTADPTGAPRAAVSYNTPYAARQHEDLTLRHPNGRRALWLERAAAENSARLANYAAETIKRLT